MNPIKEPTHNDLTALQPDIFKVSTGSIFGDCPIVKKAHKPENIATNMPTIRPTIKPTNIFKKWKIMIKFIIVVIEPTIKPNKHPTPKA